MRKNEVGFVGVVVCVCVCVCVCGGGGGEGDFYYLPLLFLAQFPAFIVGPAVQ